MMKPLLRTLFLSLLLSAGLSSTLNAQFEGTLVYKTRISGANADQLAGMMPEKTHISIREGMSHLKYEGGMMASTMSEMITKPDESYTYMVRHNQKKVLKISLDEAEQAASGKDKPKVTATGEEETIAGYSCREYKVVNQQNGQSVVQYLWTTDELNVPEGATKSSAGMSNFSSDAVEGFPLRMVMPDMGAQSNMNFNMTMEVVEVNTTPPPAERFNIPADYETKEMSVQELRQRGMR